MSTSLITFCIVTQVITWVNEGKWKKREEKRRDESALLDIWLIYMCFILFFLNLFFDKKKKNFRKMAFMEIPSRAKIPERGEVNIRKRRFCRATKLPGL
ncbi:hypothetical protein AU512_07920 [Lonsdalea iberica]|uniref:Transposase n=1 Tax=Lonsdalea iberica TaxID=1082703 RepID=A0ABX3XGC6_9GAMM|nr:hypothetical protein AU512_07920 [Lonsdalea iberica]